MSDIIEISELKIQLEEARRRFLKNRSALNARRLEIIKSQEISNLCEKLNLKNELKSYEKHCSMYNELQRDVSKIHDYVDSITLPDSILNNKASLYIEQLIREEEEYIIDLEDKLNYYKYKYNEFITPRGKELHRSSKKDYEALIKRLLGKALINAEEHMSTSKISVEINKKVKSMCVKQIKHVEDAKEDGERIKLKIKRIEFVENIKKPVTYISKQTFSFLQEESFNQEDKDLISLWTRDLGGSNLRYNKIAMKSARNAELAALAIYRKLYSEAQDISILQITNPSEELWKLADIKIDSDRKGDECLVDVKNARRGFNSPTSYSELCIPNFKYKRNGSEVTIAGMLSHYSATSGAKSLTITKVLQVNNPSWTLFKIETKEGYQLATSDEHEADVLKKAKDKCTPIDIKIKGPNKYGSWDIEDIPDQEEIGEYNDSILWLGETSNSKMKLLQNEFSKKNLLEINFTRHGSSKFFLPIWAFDYPKKYYLERNENIEALKSFPNSGKILKDASLPIRILGSCNECEDLDKECKIEFVKMLDYFSDLQRLTRPHLFLYILRRFIDCISSNVPFPSDSIRECVFGDAVDSADYDLAGGAFPSTFPLSIHDPVNSINSFINVLREVDTHCQGTNVLAFKEFKLQSANILQGRNNSNDRWKTIIAYCGGHDLKTGASCGTNPIYLGQKVTKNNFEVTHCPECNKLVCANCGFCSKDEYGVDCHLSSLRHNVIYGSDAVPHLNAPKHYLLKKGNSWIQFIEYKINLRIKYSDGKSIVKTKEQARSIWTKAKSEGYELAEKD